MKTALYFLTILGAYYFLNAQYHIAACGTADVCGIPLHDLLHRVF